MHALTIQLKRASAIVATLGFLVLVGCSSLGSNLEVKEISSASVVKTQSTNKISGLTDAMNQNQRRTMQILMVHGMTKELCPGYSRKFVAAIGEILDLRPMDGKDEIRNSNCKIRDPETYQKSPLQNSVSSSRIMTNWFSVCMKFTMQVNSNCCRKKWQKNICQSWANRLR